MNKHTRSVSLIDGHIEGMTDADIIKALECCKQGTAVDCKECPLYEDKGHTCITILSYKSLDLIKRQQTEIKEKDEMLKAQADTIFLYERVVKDKNAEIERLQKLTDAYSMGLTRELMGQNPENSIGKYDPYTDSFVKEMTEVKE